MSSEREALKAGFLAASGFGDARRALMSGDASTRVYERLHLDDGTTRIFMDQPPKAETAPCPPDATPAERVALGFNAAYRLASGRVDAFVACARYLKSLGLSAPEIEAFDAANGLAVLEDLGDDLYAEHIAAGGDEAQPYDAAIDALTVLHAARPPQARAQGRSLQRVVYCGDKCSWRMAQRRGPSLAPVLPRCTVPRPKRSLSWSKACIKRVCAGPGTASKSSSPWAWVSGTRSSNITPALLSAKPGS